MYLVWLAPGTGRRETATVMLDQVAPALLAEDILGLTMDLDDEEADVAAPVPAPPGEHLPAAVVSVWVDAYDRRAPIEEILSASAVRVAGYQVVESLYREYGGNQWSEPRRWPDGERSPGLLTVALIEQRPDMAFEEWITTWHTRVSPVSEAVQPRCRYVRNAVFRAITPDAPPYRAIVEEAWPSGNHITDPMLFYCGEGDPEKMNANLSALFTEISAVLDLETMRSLTMSEWILKS
jgi:hypothetical protein